MITSLWDWYFSSALLWSKLSYNSPRGVPSAGLLNGWITVVVKSKRIKHHINIIGYRYLEFAISRFFFQNWESREKRKFQETRKFFYKKIFAENCSQGHNSSRNTIHFFSIWPENSRFWKKLSGKIKFFWLKISHWVKKSLWGRLASNRKKSSSGRLNT